MPSTLSSAKLAGMTLILTTSFPNTRDFLTGRGVATYPTCDYRFTAAPKYTTVRRTGTYLNGLPALARLTVFPVTLFFEIRVKNTFEANFLRFVNGDTSMRLQLLPDRNWAAWYQATSINDQASRNRSLKLFFEQNPEEGRQTGTFLVRGSAPINQNAYSGLNFRCEFIFLKQPDQLRARTEPTAITYKFYGTEGSWSGGTRPVEYNTAPASPQEPQAPVDYLTHPWPPKNILDPLTMPLLRWTRGTSFAGGNGVLDGTGLSYDPRDTLGNIFPELGSDTSPGGYDTLTSDRRGAFGNVGVSIGSGSDGSAMKEGRFFALFVPAAGSKYDALTLFLGWQDLSIIFNDTTALRPITLEVVLYTKAFTSTGNDLADQVSIIANELSFLQPRFQSYDVNRVLLELTTNWTRHLLYSKVTFDGSDRALVTGGPALSIFDPAGGGVSVRQTNHSLVNIPIILPANQVGTNTRVLSVVLIDTSSYNPFAYLKFFGVKLFDTTLRVGPTAPADYATAPASPVGPQPPADFETRLIPPGWTPDPFINFGPPLYVPPLVPPTDYDTSPTGLGTPVRGDILQLLRIFGHAAEGGNNTINFAQGEIVSNDQNIIRSADTFPGFGTAPLRDNDCVWIANPTPVVIQQRINLARFFLNVSPNPGELLLASLWARGEILSSNFPEFSFSAGFEFEANGYTLLGRKEYPIMRTTQTTSGGLHSLQSNNDDFLDFQNIGADGLFLPADFLLRANAPGDRHRANFGLKLEERYKPRPIPPTDFETSPSGE